MLYKIGETNGIFDKLEPVGFKDFSSFGNIEKNLENLIADNILESLFEEARLFPIFQERQYQAEADIYALNEKGDLVIFELKRSSAGNDAVLQALRYAQDAGQWGYVKLQEKLQIYCKEAVELTKAHQDAFALEYPLEIKDFNRNQNLLIVGSAADGALIKSVDYWKKQGVSIDFLPYRVYELGGERFFEFFAKPYDQHNNPYDRKGVLFDTNRSWDSDSIWFMMENGCVAAFGKAKKFINYLNPGDIVFFSHKWTGLVAAARVNRGEIKAPDNSTLYRDVSFITSIPTRGEPLKAMPFKKVAEVTGKNFFWARTIKVPYLSLDESESLIVELEKCLQ